MSTRLQRSSRRRGGFQPPFCPNPKCDFHHPHPQWHFVRNGSRRDRCGRRRQKFLCRACKREFSVSTFTASYWLRKPHLLAQVAAHVTEGSGLRQTARLLGTSHTTVMRHLARLGRHCLLTHAQLSFDAPIQEGLVFDGFESFAHSQFSPLHANLAVGKESWFLYLFTISPLRRKGTMTPEQKRTRTLLEERYGRPHPKAVEDGIYALLRPLIPRSTRRPCPLFSDDHHSYRRALGRLAAKGSAFVHKVTSSKARRTLANDLFSVNLADLLLRHQCANHRRETIAFSKLLQGLIDRSQSDHLDFAFLIALRTSSFS